ncbi:hypothetical protein ElyMa_002780500 [Elysia marginata]|uniref:Ig-like domain-containing protein n=1 Tax=Elysia marginata TaxID=1093978 RepID=A0AAV4HNZ3_9GAST|nr:hypothetical protein ElyMa_002780500 [Elysia marginata]
MPYQSPGLVRLLFSAICSAVLVTVSAKTPATLSPDHVIRAGNPLEIYCQADLAALPPEYQKIKDLRIQRRPVTSKLNYPYSITVFNEQGNKPSVPDGRDWDIEISGEQRPFVSTSRTMTIKLTLDDVIAGDAGIYQCEVNYGLNGTIVSHAGQQEIPLQGSSHHLHPFFKNSIGVTCFPTEEIVASLSSGKHSTFGSRGLRDQIFVGQVGNWSLRKDVHTFPCRNQDFV